MAFADQVAPFHEQVTTALKNSVPFVPATGSHSPWSTINKHGFILDLSRYKAVIVDASSHTVTIKGGLLMKELQVALSKEGQFACVSNGSTVGCIPFFINGGLNAYYPLTGYGCENILSARVLTATGEIIETSESSHPDLLWAIRGAGQFFGVVLELCLRTYPFSLLGNPEGSRHLNTYIFLPYQALSVLQTLQEILSDTNHNSWGQLTVTASPTSPKSQVLILAIHSFNPPSVAQKALQPLLDLKTLKHIPASPTFASHSDHLDWTCAHGDFKRYEQIGLTASPFPRENFLQLLPLHSKLLSSFPDASRSALSLTFSSPRQPGAIQVDTSFGQCDVKFWFAALSWYTDPSQHAEMSAFNKAAMSQMRVGTVEKGFVSYTNNTRDAPIEWRYKGEERLERLRRLKKEWDPTGVFTKELLKNSIDMSSPHNWN